MVQGFSKDRSQGQRTANQERRGATASLGRRSKFWYVRFTDSPALSSPSLSRHSTAGYESPTMGDGGPFAFVCNITRIARDRHPAQGSRVGAVNSPFPCSEDKDEGVSPQMRFIPPRRPANAGARMSFSPLSGPFIGTQGEQGNLKPACSMERMTR